MKYLFIVNPVAGRGDGKEKWIDAEKIVKRMGLEYEVAFTQAPGNGVFLAKDGVARGFDTLVAVGGDGTINEVVRGIIESGTKGVTNLGIIPCGTGNDLVRALHIPMDIEQAVAILHKAHVKRIDLGRVNGDHFLNVVGIGFDAAVAYEINANIKKLKGTAAYIYGVFKVLMLYRSPQMVIKIDDEVLKGKYFLVAIGNGRYYGGGMQICPTAEPDDGLLEICVVKEVPALEVVRMLPSIFKGNHIRHRAVKIYRGKSVSVESQEIVQVQADGELKGKLPMDFAIEPGAFSVLVPSFE